MGEDPQQGRYPGHDTRQEVRQASKNEFVQRVQATNVLNSGSQLGLGLKNVIWNVMSETSGFAYSAFARNGLSHFFHIPILDLTSLSDVLTDLLSPAPSPEAGRGGPEARGRARRRGPGRSDPTRL